MVQEETPAWRFDSARGFKHATNVPFEMPWIEAAYLVKPQLPEDARAVPESPVYDNARGVVEGGRA
jgi:hypothetical protein